MKNRKVRLVTRRLPPFIERRHHPNASAAFASGEAISQMMLALEVAVRERAPDLDDVEVGREIGRLTIEGLRRHRAEETPSEETASAWESFVMEHLEENV